MKTTKDIYDIDPEKFATMLYPDVLAAKKRAALQKFRAAHIESFALPHNKTSLERKGELDVLSKEASKAIDYTEMWQEELGLTDGYEPLYSKALELCVSAHKGQFRKDGETPYSEHPIAVAEALTCPLEKIVALLHDVVEDTDVPINHIHRVFGRLVAKYVALLTKDPGQDYDLYVETLSHFMVCRNVKIEDMNHNLSSNPSRKAIAKYKRARIIIAKQS